MKRAIVKIRKPVAPPTIKHADNKYNRKVKHKGDTMKDFREILAEEDLDESSGTMFAIKSLMDKFKKTNSQSEKKKLADEMKQYETKLANNVHWKGATINKDYQKFKQENPAF